MTITSTRAELEQTAEEIFELTKMSWLARTRQPRAKGEIELTESEFLALDWLAKADPEPMTVGEIQKRIRVLPAQMSRVIRALESKEARSLIKCQINPADKRKVNVTLTDAGRKAHAAFRESRLASTIDLVAQLEARDRAEFMRILRQIRAHVHKQLSDNNL